MVSPSNAPRDDRVPTTVRYLVLVWLCAMAANSYMPRNYLGIAVDATQWELGLDDDQMGWALSAFFVTYAVVQIPAGWLAQVWGTRRALSLFSLLWSVFTAAAALAGSFPLFLLTRLGMGAAQAGIFPAATNTIAHWFPIQRRAVANGVLGSSMHIGGALTAILTGWLLTQMSLRWLVLLYALPGAIWAIGFFYWFRDRPEEHEAVNAAERELISGRHEVVEAAERNRIDRPSTIEPPTPAHIEQRSEAVAQNPYQAPRPHAAEPRREDLRGSQDLLGHQREPTPWLALFTSPAMACICGQQFFRAAGYMFYTSWYTKFLLERGTLTTNQAGFLTSLPIWATVFGSFAGGFLSDLIWSRTASRGLSRQWLSVGSQLTCAFLILAAYFVADIRLAALVITAGSFCAAIGGPCAYTITIDMGGEHVAPVFSTMNMTGNIGAAIFPLLVPPLVEATGSWQGVLFLSAGIYFAAALCWIPFNPQGTIFDQSPWAPKSGS